MKDYFSVFARSLKTFASDVQGLRSKIEELERKREDILYAPACRADVVAAVEAWLDGRRQQHRAYLEQHIVRLAQNAAKLADPASVGEHLRVNHLIAVCGYQDNVTGDKLDAGMAWLFSEQLEQVLRQTVASMPWPEEGLPYAQRAAAVEKLDHELSKLRRQYDELVAEAAKHGLGVEQVN